MGAMFVIEHMFVPFHADVGSAEGRKQVQADPWKAAAVGDDESSILSTPTRDVCKASSLRHRARLWATGGSALVRR